MIFRGRRRGCFIFAGIVVTALLTLVGVVVALDAAVDFNCGDRREAFEVLWQNRNRADREPRWTADGSAIVVNIDDAIYGVDVMGDRLWRIPNEQREGRQYGPTLAPDGRVVYLNYLHSDHCGFVKSGTTPQRFHIETVSFDGGQPDVLLDLPRDMEIMPVIHPDGAHVGYAYQKYAGRGRWDYGIRIIDQKGDVVSHQQIRGYLIPGRNGTFWSPDGRRIALRVRRFRDEGGYGDAIVTYEVSPDLKALRELRSSAIYDYMSQPAWSPAGDILYYMRKERADYPAFQPIVLESMKADGSDQRVIAEWAVPQDGFGNLAVSPDGRRILVALTHGDHFDVTVMNADGADMATVMEARCPNCAHEALGRPTSATWSPDGAWVAVLTISPHAENVLTVVRPDGSEPKALIKRDSNKLPVAAQSGQP